METEWKTRKCTLNFNSHSNCSNAILARTSNSVGIWSMVNALCFTVLTYHYMNHYCFWRGLPISSVFFYISTAHLQKATPCFYPVISILKCLLNGDQVYLNTLKMPREYFKSVKSIEQNVFVLYPLQVYPIKPKACTYTYMREYMD